MAKHCQHGAGAGRRPGRRQSWVPERGTMAPPRWATRSAATSTSDLAANR